MKRFAFLILIAALVVSCSPAATGTGDTGGSKAGAPAKMSVTNARGLFLQSSGSKAVRTRGIMGRDVVAVSGGTLGVVTSGGAIQTATFTDAEGNTVDATIGQAVQLTDTYVLLSWSAGTDSGTAALNMATGSLVAVSVVPSNWGMIFARGTEAWYVSGGGIYSLNLATGASKLLSTGATEYASDGTPIQANYPWDSGTTWLYSDLAGNTYAVDLLGTGYFLANAFTSSGSTVDFGTSSVAYQFGLWLPIGIISSHEWIATDSASGAIWLLVGTDEWDNNPYQAGHGAAITGVDIKVFPVTLDPSVSGVVSVDTWSVPTYALRVTAYGGVTPSTHIGFGTGVTTSVFSNGPQTWKIAADGSLSNYDTSAVPLKNNSIAGQVLNWAYSGGCIYAGPTDTTSTINLVEFNSDGTVTDPELVNDSTITSWSVVGGVLFYTTATGTYQATVNTTTGAISTPQVYSGGTVTAVTQ